MFSRILHRVIVFCLLGVAPLFCLQAADQALRPVIPLSEEERAWIVANPLVTIALDDANPPLNARQPQGTFAGLSVDYVRLIATKAGLELRLVGAPWSEALGQAMRHEVDGIMSASYKEDRRVALDFTEAYCETPEAVVMQAGAPAISALAGLAGQRVAVVGGSVRVPLLRQQVPSVQVVEVANSGDGIRALVEGRADAFFDDLPVIQEHIDRAMVKSLRVALLFFQAEAGAQRLGIRNDQPLLTGILNKAIASISPAEHRALRDRWLRLASGAAVQRDLGLNQQERDWLASHPVIRIACDPDWEPIEWREASGRWRGLSIDYMQRLEALLGIRFEIDAASSWQEARKHAADGLVDCFASFAETSERRRSWLFTAPYVSFPIAIFSRSDVSYLHGLSALNGKSVALVAGYVEDELVRRDFPGITVVPVVNANEGLTRLRRGEVQAFVGGLLTTAYKLQQAGDVSIHVAGETTYSYRQSMAVRHDWPELRSILDKALAAIPPDERDSLWQRWVTVSYERSADYSLLWKVGAPLGCLLALFLYWNRRLSSEVRKRARAESELIQYRDQLEALVRGRTTELQRALDSLRRLAAAIGQTAEGVVLATTDGHIDFVNPAFSRMTGIANENAMGMPLATLGIPWADESVRRGHWRGRVSGNRPDTTAYDLEVTITAVCNAQGQVVDLLAIVRDMTLNRHIEERLAQSQKLEAVGTLASGIAHDFNNVLGAIIGASEMAQLPGMSAEQRKTYFTMTLGACDRARQLVRQILTFARATPSEHRSVELAPVLAEALSLLRASLPATIELRQQLESNAVVMGDSTRFHQVIMNLGTNAGLAMPDGGVLAVTLSTIDVDAIFAAPHHGLRCGPAARITVSDTGVGMSPAVRARIFEPFFTTRTQGQGTGLGLAVVHGIIKDSAGAITVESAPGHGTTFTILLPLCEKREHDSTAERIAIRGHRERILFVDDEPVLCNLAAETLGNLNYLVTTVADGHSAVELLRRDPKAFDLLITDSTMPRMTGPALIAAARIMNPQLRIILCSGQSMSNAERYFLAKPMTMNELGHMVRTALDHPSET